MFLRGIILIFAAKFAENSNSIHRASVGIDMYIWQHKEWPAFRWDDRHIANMLAQVRLEQGRLLGMMSSLGFDVQNSAILDSMTADVVMSSEIEGITLNVDEVRSSIAWQLGMESIGVPASDRYVEGVVDVMFDAIHHYEEPLTQERLSGWHSALFPHGTGFTHITVGAWRRSSAPMQVVSGRYGHEKVHYQAPNSADVPKMMSQFIEWINDDYNTDAILKAAIAHLWFVTIHPFSDGNGRLSRTIMDMMLAQADGTSHRFYSMSSAIGHNRKAYYDVLERTQKGGLDITDWLVWFLNCLESAIKQAIAVVARTLKKASFWENHRQTSMNERQTRMINKLWDGFEGKLTTSKWAKITKCSPDTALRDIQDLIHKGILLKTAAGGRSTSYELIE